MSRDADDRQPAGTFKKAGLKPLSATGQIIHDEFLPGQNIGSANATKVAGLLDSWVFAARNGLEETMRRIAEENLPEELGATVDAVDFLQSFSHWHGRNADKLSAIAAPSV